jgi:hypothetical protein
MYRNAGWLPILWDRRISYPSVTDCDDESEAPTRPPMTLGNMRGLDVHCLMCSSQINSCRQRRSASTRTTGLVEIALHVLNREIVRLHLAMHLGR